MGSIQARLVDVSISGLSCELADSNAFAQGTTVPLELWVGEERAVAAQVEVARVDVGSGRLAVRFLDAVPEPAVLRKLAQSYAARQEICSGVTQYDAVPESYRSAVFQVVTVLTHWRTFLNRREAEIASSDEVSELVELAEKRLRSDWFRVHEIANECAEMLYPHPGYKAAAKLLTELLVTPLLMDAPIWRRAFEKPRGYPGDFELMNYMYDEARQGRSVYGRVMHQLGREERLAATVRNRRDLLVRKIREMLVRAQADGRTEVRICNIGAGPARELEEVLSELNLPVEMRIWLVDQDEDALAFAYERLRKASLSRGVRVDLNCRYVSFKQLLESQELLRELRGQDLLYSAGLFDYLSDRAARTLVSQLSTLLQKDGVLFVGNAAADRGVRWVPDIVLDWSMRYRTAAEMLDLARNVPVAHLSETQSDDSGAWHFLSVTACRDATNG